MQYQQMMSDGRQGGTFCAAVILHNFEIMEVLLNEVIDRVIHTLE